MESGGQEIGKVQIVGFDSADATTGGVETIDLWYSQKRGVWCVERLDRDGNQIGAAHRCGSEADAQLCLDAWLRAHGEARLVAPTSLSQAERRLLSHRRAA